MARGRGTALVTAIETNGRYADFDATIMEGVGHYPHLERPEEFNRHMAALLAEIAGRSEARGSE